MIYLFWFAIIQAPPYANSQFTLTLQYRDYKDKS